MCIEKNLPPLALMIALASYSQCINLYYSDLQFGFSTLTDSYLGVQVAWPVVSIASLCLAMGVVIVGLCSGTYTSLNRMVFFVLTLMEQTRE